MFPDLFSIGPLTIHSYGLFLVLGIIGGLLVALWFGRDQGIPASSIMDMGFIIILSSLIGSRLAYILMNIAYYKENPLDMIIFWKGGLVFSGGLVAVVLALAWYLKRHHLSIWKIGDLWAPSAAIGQGIGRLGCFFAGCCYGKPTEMGWGVIFTNPKSLAPLNIPLHPTQLYGSLSGFIIFGVLYYLHAKKQFEGQLLLWFLILHSTARLFIERFRGDERGFIFGSDMTVTQLFALLILLAAVITLLIRKPNEENPPT